MIEDLPFAATMLWPRVESGRSRRALRHAPVAIASSALIAAIGYILPAHQLDARGDVHSNFADGGVLPLVLLAAVAIVAIASRGRRFGAGMTAGGFAMIGAALALAPVLVTHLVRDVHNAAGQYIFVAGILATFTAGAALAIGEPLCHARDRRR